MIDQLRAATDLEGALGACGQPMRSQALILRELCVTPPMRPPGGSHLSAFATQSLSVNGARPVASTGGLG